AHAAVMANYLGYVNVLLSNVVEARHWLEGGLAIFERIHDTACSRYAEALFFAGILAQEIGQNSQAADYLHRASPLLSRLSPNYYLQTQEVLISIYTNTGDY